VIPLTRARAPSCHRPTSPPPSSLRGSQPQAVVLQHAPKRRLFRCDFPQVARCPPPERDHRLISALRPHPGDRHDPSTEGMEVAEIPRRH